MHNTVTLVIHNSHFHVLFAQSVAFFLDPSSTVFVLCTFLYQVGFISRMVVIPLEVDTLLCSKSQMHVLKLLALNCHVALKQMISTQVALSLLQPDSLGPVHNSGDLHCVILDVLSQEVKSHGNLQSCTTDEAAWMSWAKHLKYGVKLWGI